MVRVSRYRDYTECGKRIVGLRKPGDTDELGCAEIFNEMRFQRRLAEMLGVSRSTVSRKLCGKSRISVLGLFTQPVQVNALAVVLNEVRVVGAITYCRPGRHSDFEVALRIIEADPERAHRVISHRFPLREADEAFRTAADKSTASIKVQVQP